MGQTSLIAHGQSLPTVVRCGCSEAASGMVVTQRRSGFSVWVTLLAKTLHRRCWLRNHQTRRSNVVKPTDPAAMGW